MPLHPIRRFRDLHRGGRAVLVCNGPSLNAMDLAPLAGEIVIGLNKIHLGMHRFGFYPRYVVAVNAKVVEQARDALLAMSAVKFIGARAAHLIPAGPFVHHIPVLDPPVTFSTDLAIGFREGGTVTHAALQVAYYMGFAEVVIIGMDHRFVYDGDPHAARLIAGDDPNHFDPGYFRGQVWDNPDLARSEASYAAARAAFEADGRRILDATLDGACTVFQKADYRALFGL